MRLLLGGAGGAPTNNVIMSLRRGGSGDHLIGMSAVPSDLFLADVEERYVVPYAAAAEYPDRLAQVLRASKADLLHAQHDFEVRAISRLRDQILEQGVKLYLPSVEAVETCVDKGRSAQIWQAHGVPIPDTMLVATLDDLKKAFERYSGRVWLRAAEGGGGKGALPVRSSGDLEFARMWIERFNGWGRFTAAEMLTADTVTWLSIWYEGELVVAQTRKRLNWSFGDRTLSGVTGVTGVAETFSDPIVDRTAMDAIQTIDRNAHGIFGVDMTYDHAGKARVTEINIGRFFTTVHFFTEAGVNFPQIYRDIALVGEFPSLSRKVNPLPDGLIWIRGMDVHPVLTSVADLEALG